MNTLLIDTHSPILRIVLYKNNIVENKKIIEDATNHGVLFMPTLTELLNESKIDIHDIKSIIVVNGPGSFTGIRIGVTIAKTLAYTLEIPIKVINSFELYDNKKQDYDYMVLSEKNGYYITNIKDKKNMFYLNIREGQEWIKKHKCKFPTEIDFEYVLKESNQKENCNPHQVNPLYIKKIEVEK